MAGNFCLPIDDDRFTRAQAPGSDPSVIARALRVAVRAGNLRAVHVLTTELALLAHTASPGHLTKVFGLHVSSDDAAVARRTFAGAEK
jgi:hypothetical protein